MPDARNAKTSEPAGTATMSHRGCFSLRSIRTGIVPSGHEQADLLDVGASAVELAEDCAFVHARDAVSERENLVEVLADQENRDAQAGGFAQVDVHRLDRADVEAARGRCREQQARLSL